MRSDQVFILYNKFNGTPIERALGLPEYSYWFVEQYFRRGLEEFAEVIEISSADQIPVDLMDSSFLLSFAPPHQTPEKVQHLAVPVFAWEYGTLPSVTLGGDPRWNWPKSLSVCRGTITHAEFVATSVRQANPELVVGTIVSPIFEKFESNKPWQPSSSELIKVEGAVWDSSGSIADIESSEIRLSGVVFTYVFNPFDGRKRWEDAVSAFIVAARENSEACIVLKLIHSDENRAVAYVRQFVGGFGDYRCRVVIICGFLSGHDYESLVRLTTFTVNTSCGEGQCLPLLEYMSAGRPAISPRHTAMADYVTTNNSIVVAHEEELVPFPNDPDLVFRTRNFPIIWESLVDGFRRAVSLASDRSDYLRFSTEARESARRLCSLPVFESRMRSLCDALPAVQLQREVVN